MGVNGDSQGSDDEVEVVIQPTSGTGVSDQLIFLLPERNEDNTGWLSHEGIKTVSVFNKMRPEDMTTGHKQKEMIEQEVSKNRSVLDLWIRDKVNPST